MSKNKTICIFCGANSGNSESIITETKSLTQALIEMDFDLVYGGGKSGLMGLIADQFMASDKKVIGIRPSKLIEDEDAHTSLTELIVVKDMFERKAEMMNRADFFIALPGGVGTLDEIMDVYTNVKIGFSDKFCALLNVEGFYQGLANQLAIMVEKSFLKPQDRELLISGSATDLVECIQHRMEEIDKIAFIEIKNRKILTARSKGKDKFYIPGGKREGNEEDLAALEREVREELSVDIRPDSAKFIGVFRAQAHGKPEGIKVRMACYSADYTGSLAPASEIEEIKWMTTSDQELVSHVDRVIFRYLKERGQLD